MTIPGGPWGTDRSKLSLMKLSFAPSTLQTAADDDSVSGRCLPSRRRRLTPRLAIMTVDRVVAVSAMDSQILHARCGQLRRRSHMSRHSHTCCGESEPSTQPRSCPSSANTQESFASLPQVVSTSYFRR